MSDSWTEKAERLAGDLAAKSDGGRLFNVERVARENGVSAATAQHLLRAWRFLERVKTDEPEVAKLIAALPYQGVLPVERWHARNRSELLAYIASNAKLSVRQLIAAEKAARALPTLPGTPAHHAIDVLASVEDEGSLPGVGTRLLMDRMGVVPFDLTRLDWTEVSSDYERAHGVEFSASSADGNRVALLVGPQAQAEGYYTRNAKLVWFGAVSATIYFDVVIVLLPTITARAACLTSMPLPPNGESGWPKWNLRAAPRGRPRSGPTRPASPRHGIIVFTTPEALPSDWQT